MSFFVAKPSDLYMLACVHCSYVRSAEVEGNFYKGKQQQLQEKKTLLVRSRGE
jgi:hypothetical protein